MKITGASDTELLPSTGSILRAIATDPSLLDKVFAAFPNQAQLQEAHDLYKGSYNGSLGGGAEEQAILGTHREMVTRRFSRFIALAKMAAEDEPTLLPQLGIVPEHAKRSTSFPALTAPSNPKARHGEKHGEVILSAGAVKRARSFDIDICEGDPTVEANWRHADVSPRCSKIVLTGLTPGKVYSFRIRALGSNGFGPWSSIVTLMAI